MNTVLDRFEESASKWREWQQLQNEIMEAVEPLRDFLESLPSGVRPYRMRVPPLYYRRLISLLKRRHALAEQHFGEPSLPDGVPMKPSLFGVFVEELKK